MLLHGELNVADTELKVPTGSIPLESTVIQMPPDPHADGLLKDDNNEATVSSQDPNVINQETDALLGASRLEGQKQSELLSEAEVRNIIWIKMGPEGLKGVDGDKKHVLYRVALEHWEEKEKLLSTKLEKNTNLIMSVRNEIYQLIGFYSVFQGVLLTAVAQSNLLHCNNWWSVFTLSALASFVTVYGVLQKFDTLLRLEDVIGAERISLKVLYRCFLAMTCTLLCVGALNPEPLLRNVGLVFHQTVHHVSLECKRVCGMPCLLEMFVFIHCKCPGIYNTR
jgi:hypothetical protein